MGVVAVVRWAIVFFLNLTGGADFEHLAVIAEGLNNQLTTTIIIHYTPSWCISSQLQNTSNEMASFENKNCFPKWFEGPETWIEILCPEEHLAFIYFVFQNPGRISPLICNPSNR